MQLLDGSNMAKKIPKQKRAVTPVLLILTFLLSSALFVVTLQTLSGKTSLAELGRGVEGLAILVSFLLWYLQQQHYGGDKWKNWLRVLSVVALLVFAVFFFIDFHSFISSDQSVNR